MRTILGIFLSLASLAFFLVSSLFLAAISSVIISRYLTIMPHLPFIPRLLLILIFYPLAIYLTYITLKKDFSKTYLFTLLIISHSLTTLFFLGMLLLFEWPPFGFLPLRITLGLICDPVFIKKYPQNVGHLGDKKYINLCTFKDGPLNSYPIDQQTQDTPITEISLTNRNQLFEFYDWATLHGITLQGVIRNVNYLYKNKLNPDSDTTSLDKIPGVYLAYLGLKTLPDSVLEVMRGKTIYFSTVYFDDPYHPGVALVGYDNNKDLNNLNSGILLSPPIFQQGAIHEVGHILEAYGIDSFGGDKFPNFKKLRDEKNSLFDTSNTDPIPDDKLTSVPIPKGYISNYSTKNKAENFADTFAYYVWEGNLFRSQMVNDPLLIQKYYFMKNKIFNGREY